VFVVQHEGAIQPTLLDFGIVKVQEREGESHLTKAGDVLGSPDYMSPEQARGLDDVNHLTDVWSFAVVLYEAIAGRTPFKGANYNALLRQIVEEIPPTLQELTVADADLSAIVEKGMSKVPEQRYESMGDLGRALASWLISKGVTEDICGATLETKRLRLPESLGRVGRAAFSSIADGWPIEGGSGVRRNAPEGLPTVPAPPDVSDGSMDGHSAEAQPAARPNSRSRALWFGGAAGLLLGIALASWAVLRGQKPASTGARESAAALRPAASTPAPSPPPSAVESGGAPEAAGQEPAPTTNEEHGAQDAPEAVSSKVGRASGAKAHGVRPAPVSPKKGAGSVGNGKAKSGDLLSPY
jgi:serine/threonine-protein kinase